MKLRYCKVCNSYTLEEEHCGRKTCSGHPPKFSIVDRYGEYRRKAKEMLK